MLTLSIPKPCMSITEQIYDTLLTELISLKIPPGTRIAVDALVRRFAVSQTPIRAALIKLEAEGLVVRTRNVGYSAAPMPTRKQFEEIYEMRLLLEPPSAAQAASKMAPQQIKELRQLADEMAALHEDNPRLTYSKFAVLDAELHACITASTDNQLLIDTMRKLSAHMHLFRLHFHSTVTSGAIEEHDALVSAIEKRDSERAHETMYFHIISSRDRMAPFFELLE